MSVYKRKSGQWAVRVDVDRDADGRRVRKNLGTFPTRKAAESAERKALEARDRGVDFDLAALTVGEACDRFLDRCRAKNLAPASLTRYAEHFRDLSAIRDAPIGRLTHGQVCRVYQAAAARNLSPKSLRVLHGALRAVVAWAVPESPSMRALTLAARDLPSVPKTLARALDEGEVQRLLAAAAATPWEAFLVLAICTGARRSELAALRWDDIDFAHRTAKIARSLAFDVQGDLAEKSTKTGTERFVSLNVLALDTLRAHRANQAEERLRAGPAYEANNLIFADPVGRPWNPHSISNAFARLAKRAGVCGRLHDLRHSCASWLLQGGTDVRTVAGILGHSTPVTTLGTYAHVMPGAQAQAVEQIADRLRRRP